MSLADGSASGRVAATGIGRLYIQPINRQTWTVKQVSVNGQVTGATAVGAGSACNLYKGALFVAATIPQNGVIVEPPPLVLKPNERAEVRWTGATPGASIEIYYIYDDGEGGL